MLEMLRTELHCHNVFSNGHVGDLEPPFDCNVTVNEQLQKALDSKYIKKDSLHLLREWSRDPSKWLN